MLALLKKNMSSGGNDGGLPWRADFRQLELLPDTKTIRTSFLVNALVITLLSVVVLFFFGREIALSNLKSEIVLIQTQIDAALVPNTLAEEKYKNFQVEEKKLKDVKAFVASEFNFPDYLIHLASLMPSGVRSNRIEFRGVGNNILVLGVVDGQDANASATASNFFKILQEDLKFKKTFSSITNSNLGRNAAANALSFELVFTFNKSMSAAK